LLGHKIFYITLWPTGVPMLDDAMLILETEFPGRYVYGENYLNLGYGAGQEAAIKLISTDLAKLFPTDQTNRPFGLWPIARGITSLQDMDLTISVGAGYPGTKEWVQYAGTPYPEIELVAGVTGVSAPPQYPYYPQQLIGMLPAIKGAAEYEAALAAKYGTAGVALPNLLDQAIALRATVDTSREDVIEQLTGATGLSTAHLSRIMDGRINCLPRSEMEAIAEVLEITVEAMIEAAEQDGCDYADGHDYPTNYLNYGHTDYQEALTRMGPQLSAHLLMLLLIVLGNVIFFIERRKGARQ